MRLSPAQSRRARLYCFATILASLALGGCATPDLSLSGDSPPEDVAAVFAPCQLQADPAVDPLSFLTSTHDWWQVLRIESATRHNRDGVTFTNPATFEVVDGSKT